MTATENRPWRGVLVATALPLNDDLSVDYDRYARHCAWLVENGCDGVVPNGSLGEYQVLTPEERAKVVETAVSAIGGSRVMPGVAAYGSTEARRWAEQARDAGCRSVMLLPPNAYRADERSVLAHYEAVAEVGVPVVAYNNPIDTKVDLVPELLAKLHAEGYIHGVKEFSGDVRRAYRIAELSPELDLLIGADDVLLELAVAGAKGWVAGYPNALPAASVELYHAAVEGDLDTARLLYRRLHPLLRWDSRVEFVQAIKLSMDIVGRHGGRVRPPRVPLLPEQEATVRAATEKALAAGLA
ncbi:MULTISPECIES: dihydrodipicolinate synthase family protein [unclassified Streptomyces]|uniref:dihydrodipicolinate synthase family protein n=1 Tax=unclassified Streptomyces TaxID=2593676 RepID=UPI0011620520|nr:MULTISPECIES: dihydrodipicolinate synthase family protein [unclassified Streptomyces]NMI62421.1 dihydrodipicolinate synthase family protein [Streptomyces sp. RLA2-12]QDN61423.1 dihydrodipicolinate synthase family protein [Streptomyces sp. S1D4-20]QDN71476.1 dihydrodipicolinate synthase family protein [Streptomyces sp. S1D4-14]QDO53932.1 dihydrodipicolinate synthase family protein [Streptomyces sp. RLB3-5]QDO64177.1 dihydrodipicolinate synthase family protein [Streptomyces sp. RLB1-8]